MMEDESWVIVSSDDESCNDSDKIDSDIEAELYSIIHHGADTVTSRIDNYICQSPQTNSASKTKKDKFLESSPPDSNLCTSFENSERKELDVNSSIEEVQIISSSSKKRKSDVLDNIIESIQLESSDEVGSELPHYPNATNFYKKQKTNRIENLKKKSDTKSVLNRTVEVDSSDSDSIIWTEADDCDIKLKLNLDNEEIVLSDSFSSDDSSSPFLGDNSFTSPANLSLPSTSSSSKNPRDLWYVNSEDMFRSKRPSSRYHERAVLHCTNCNLKGHSVKFCSVPKAVKCFICGGSHIPTRCKDRLCHKCFRPGHDSRFCNQRLISICLHCNMKGHPAKHCPDLWRRYHLTTNQRNIVVGCPFAQNTPLYCFNCGEKGHYGAECRVPRADRLSFPTWTSVLAYVHPYDTIQRANDIQRNTRLGGIPVWSPTPMFRPNLQHQMPIYRQPPAQMQVPVNRQPPPQMQMPIKKKKNKKKKNSLANNLQTPPGGMKKMENKTDSALQTPGSSTKKKTQQEVYFPRTPPNRKERRIQKKLRKQQNKLFRQRQMNSDSFTNGLHKRLGLFK